MRHLARVVFAGGLALAVLSPSAAVVLDRGWGRDVILISPHSPDVISVNKASWTKGDPVVDIYGIRNGDTTRVLFANPSHVITPDEDAGLTLLKVDKQAGENPLQAQTVWFFAKWLVLGGVVASALGLLAAFRLRRRSEA